MSKRKTVTFIELPTYDVHEKRPTKLNAIVEMKGFIDTKRRQNIKIIKINHGRGNHIVEGFAGTLKKILRQELIQMKRMGSIKKCIWGEDFNNKTQSTLDIVQDYPILTSIKGFGEDNDGIAIIIIS